MQSGGSYVVFGIEVPVDFTNLSLGLLILFIGGHAFGVVFSKIGAYGPAGVFHSPQRHSDVQANIAVVAQTMDISTGRLQKSGNRVASHGAVKVTDVQLLKGVRVAEFNQNLLPGSRLGQFGG